MVSTKRRYQELDENEHLEEPEGKNFKSPALISFVEADDKAESSDGAMVLEEESMAVALARSDNNAENNCFTSCDNSDSDESLEIVYYLN